MERLQAALSKARDKREAKRTVSSERRTSLRPGGRSQTEEYWQALQTIEVSERRLELSRVVTRDAGPAAAPFDILRTKVLLQMRQNGWSRLAITSPMPRSGKTTTACNLALGLGRQRELRSMLLDFDLRDPSVGEFFEVSPPYSIGDLLSGQVEFSDQALRFGDNVAISAAKHAESDPTRLLLSEESAKVLDDIEGVYKPDLMIFDLPSVLVNDDTRAFLKNVDCALIVIRANATRYSHFDTCEREIAEHTNVLGVVLNAYTNKDPSREN